VAGDTINLAARLSGLALPNEIVVAPDTGRLTEGYFVLEEWEPTMIKGKKEPVMAYKVISPRALPRKVHRRPCSHGLGGFTQRKRKIREGSRMRLGGHSNL